ncbi:Reticulata-related 1 isoform 3 [Theobroma cacao]|uniref:Reticulata-related 1 isoform 3 n=1 Tax=Theobroma cacao TaxID=3641 RepID=A0A061ERU6_THECC|nr:Reticulata-related 1 isoform 3 [Theobroma cacao]
MSGFGLLHLVSVKNDVFLSKLWGQDLSFVKSSSKRFLFSVKKKQRLVILSLSQPPEAGPQSGAATTIVTKESSGNNIRKEEVRILGSGNEEAKIDEGNGGGFFDGNGGNGKFNNGGGRGGGGGGDGDDGEKGDPEEEEFGPIKKRGKDFWAEFELYVADLLVGVVVNIALVGMLAPYARIGQPSISTGFLGRMQHAYGALPSSVFEAERPGCRFTVKQRIGTYFYKGVLYGAVGFACGIIGQGIANLIMTAKRSMKKSEEDIPVPPLVKSAALWGVFLAVSSNTRYQIINGLERLVEASPLAKQVPPVAMAFTVGVRFANNIYGGMQFVDWARWSGVQ